MDEQLFINELADYDRKLRQSEEQIAYMQEKIRALQYEAIHDSDTQLYSNAYFHSRLNEEIIRSERYRHFLSLILIHVELEHTHATQQVTHEIKRIGLEMMTGLTRRTDIVTHYRRRQIVIMLPETDPRGVGILLQRYQAMFPNNGRRLTYAVLTYPNDASNIESILNRLQDFSEDLFRGSGRLGGMLGGMLEANG